MKLIDVIINEELLNEQAGALFSKLLKSMSSSVTSNAVKNLIKTSVDDLAKLNVKRISRTALNKNQNYKNALIQSADELSRKNFKKPFSEITSAQQTQIANEVGVGLRDGIESELQKIGKGLEKDISKTQNKLSKATAKGQTDKVATLNKELASYTKKLTDINGAGTKSIQGMGAPTRRQLLNMMKNGSKVGPTTPISTTKGFKYYFDKVKNSLVPLASGTTKTVRSVYLTAGLLKTLTALGVGGGAIYLLYQFIEGLGDEDFVLLNEDGTPINIEDIADSNIIACVNSLINNGGDIVQEEENIYIKLANTGNETYDSQGGLNFYLNGIVTYGDNSRRGKWTCSISGEVSTLQENKSKLSLSVIFEQEFDEELTDDVDRIRRYLDFPVTQSGLRSAYQILKKYYDNGKGEEFLRRYKRSGWGRGDMEKTLKYIVTTNETSIEIKDQLKNLVKRIRSGENQNQGPQTGDNNQRRRLEDYINITWDDEQVQTGSGSSTAPNVRYFDCENWDINTKPYIIGCQSSKIREIQSCLGENPDGKFGPNTQKALMDIEADMSKGITAEIYNRVMRNCNRPELETNQQTQQEPETTQQEPETTQSTDGELQTGVEPIQFGEISFSSPQETGEQFYMRLLNNNRFIGSSDKNRIKYKDYPLTKDEYNKLTEFLSTKGFYPLKAKEKGDEKMKYVWKKSSRQ
jgi:hypothetical protein